MQSLQKKLYSSKYMFPSGKKIQQEHITLTLWKLGFKLHLAWYTLFLPTVLWHSISEVSKKAESFYQALGVWQDINAKHYLHMSRHCQSLCTSLQPPSYRFLLSYLKYEPCYEQFGSQLFERNGMQVLGFLSPQLPLTLFSLTFSVHCKFQHCSLFPQSSETSAYCRIHLYPEALRHVLGEKLVIYSTYLVFFRSFKNHFFLDYALPSLAALQCLQIHAFYILSSFNN